MPRYPYRARRKGQEGRVVLRVRVSPAGSVERLWVQETSGHALLDQAALETVRDWRLVPARRQGRRVAGLIEVPIVFDLN